METLQQKINLLEGGITGTPLDEDDITQTLQELAAGGMPAIPEEMLAFLRRYNGFLYDGRCIFGIDNKHHFLYDILGENLAADNPEPNNILLLGSTDSTYVAWLQNKKYYAIIDKSTFLVLHRLKNFTNAVKYILKIDD